MISSIWDFLQSIYSWFFGPTLSADPFILFMCNVFSFLFCFSALYFCLFFPFSLILKKVVKYFSKGTDNENEINE